LTQRELPALIDGLPAQRAAESLAARAATVYDAFADIAKHYPQLPFLCIPARAERPYHPEGIELTYGDALAQIDSQAEKLKSSGYTAGRRVALMLDNRPEHFITQLALYKLGATQVPVNPEYLDHELSYLLEHSEADIALGLDHNIEQLARVAKPLNISAVLHADAYPAAIGEPRESVTGRAAEAAIIYTSGTTGRPKGCVIDQEYHFSSAIAYASLGGRLALAHRTDRIYVPLPVYHINAGINTLTTVILTGNCLILPDRFHPDSWWQDIVSTRATAMHYLGIIPPILLKQQPSALDSQHTLRFGLGAGIDPQLHQPFEERFGVPMVEVWGMTETGRFIGDCHEPRQIHTRAFGKIGDILEARVADDDGNPVPADTPGELLVRTRGDNPRHGFFREYLKDEAATRAAWADNWFHTGDVVTQQADGMLHFVERRKNIIRRSGENISAVEVENALIDHEAIDAVAVIGVVDEMRDEEVMACIVATAGSNTDDSTARSIFDHGRQMLTYYKLPGWIIFVDKLPKTGTQKVQKGLIFPDHEDPRQAAGAIDLRQLKKRKHQTS
jgi:crotonobetaine/carnitine-CoA ligase